MCWWYAEKLTLKFGNTSIVTAELVVLNNSWPLRSPLKKNTATWPMAGLQARLIYEVGWTYLGEKKKHEKHWRQEEREKERHVFFRWQKATCSDLIFVHLCQVLSSYLNICNTHTHTYNHNISPVPMQYLLHNRYCWVISCFLIPYVLQSI